MNHNHHNHHNQKTKEQIEKEAQAAIEAEKRRQHIRANSFQPRRKADGIIDFLMMKEQEVLDKFAALPNAQKVGSGDRQFVYVPGTRPDKVLLVAHADTVFCDAELDLLCYNKETIYSNSNKVGIGADDRAGCLILWWFRNSGHSLLIPNGEESGCIGSGFLMNQKGWKEIINDHRFALQFDRMNANDIATYNVGEKKFEAFLEDNYKTDDIKYKITHGSSTDIRVLFDQADYDEDKRDKVIPAGNVSVGYYNQHSSSEYLVLSELNRTISLTEKLLTMENIPQFYQEKRIFRKHNHSSSSYSYAYPKYFGHDISGCYGEEEEEIVTKKVNVNNHIVAAEEYLVCISCQGIVDIFEVENNNKKCVLCDQSPFEIK